MMVKKAMKRIVAFALAFVFVCGTLVFPSHGIRTRYTGVSGEDVAPGGIVYQWYRYDTTYEDDDDEQLAQYVADLGFPVTVLRGMTGDYNCHSYAWYSQFESNDRYIENVTPFVEALQPVPEDQVEVGMIVVYHDTWYYYDTPIENYPVHSGIVTAIEGDRIIVTSKWGDNALFEHDLENVQKGYLYCDEVAQMAEGVAYEDLVYTLVVSYYDYPYLTSHTHDYSSETYTELSSTRHMIQCVDCSQRHRHNHTITSTTSTHHVTFCTECQGSHNAPHQFSYSRSLKPSVVARSHTATCNLCGYSKTEAHSFVPEGIGGRYACSKCGYSTTSPGGNVIMGEGDEGAFTD